MLNQTHPHLRLLLALVLVCKLTLLKNVHALIKLNEGLFFLYTYVSTFLIKYLIINNYVITNYG